MIRTTCSCGFVTEGVPYGAKLLSGSSPFAGYAWNCLRCDREVSAPEGLCESFRPDPKMRAALTNLNEVIESAVANPLLTTEEEIAQLALDCCLQDSAVKLSASQAVTFLHYIRRAVEQGKMTGRIAQLEDQLGRVATKRIG